MLHMLKTNFSSALQLWLSPLPLRGFQLDCADSELSCAVIKRNCDPLCLARLVCFNMLILSSRQCSSLVFPANPSVVGVMGMLPLGPEKFLARDAHCCA